MSFENELSAFRAYAKALPGNCVFLVDTYDVMQGIENAIIVGKELRAKGHEMIGIRLDSGDLATLSKHARARLDIEGFKNAIIIASNDLDEHTIASLREQGAPIDAWGVGTQLTTGGSQAALGGIFKVVAIQNADFSFEPKIKISDNADKTTNPGRHQVRRYYQEKPLANGRMQRAFLCDVMFDIDLGISPDSDGNVIMVNPEDSNSLHAINHKQSYEDLLVPIFRGGTLVYQCPSLDRIKERATWQLKALKSESQRLMNPEPYLACFEQRFHQQNMSMIRSLRGFRSLHGKQVEPVS
jgi:nicotinate phosphoribosyltransferase